MDMNLVIFEGPPSVFQRDFRVDHRDSDIRALEIGVSAVALATVVCSEISSVTSCGPQIDDIFFGDIVFSPRL